MRDAVSVGIAMVSDHRSPFMVPVQGTGLGCCCRAMDGRMPAGGGLVLFLGTASAEGTCTGPGPVDDGDFFLAERDAADFGRGGLFSLWLRWRRCDCLGGGGGGRCMCRGCHK